MHERVKSRFIIKIFNFWEKFEDVTENILRILLGLRSQSLKKCLCIYHFHWLMGLSSIFILVVTFIFNGKVLKDSLWKAFSEKKKKEQ